MEWLESMSKIGQDKSAVDEEMVDDEDFYGNGEGANAALDRAAIARGASAGHGASQRIGDTNPSTPNPATPSTANAGNNLTAEQRKMENQRKAEQLRAKLIANRQNTPIRANTPNKMTTKTETPRENSTAKPIETTPAPSRTLSQHESGLSSDVFGVNQLLQEGKAAADAKAREEDMAKEKAKRDEEGVTEEIILSNAEMTSTDQTAPAIQQTHQTTKTDFDTVPQQQQQQQNQLPNLATEYYADLAIWLDVTGYHDIDYRNSKLRTYKERKALEEEAARIQEKLEKLRQAEQAEMAAMRGGTPYPIATPRPQPPALPTAPPTAAGAAPPARKASTNGVKRAHSPEPMLAEKSARPREDAENGIRIRGANESPQDHPRRLGRPPACRVSYPDPPRQNPLDGPDRRMSRDPSLERRQAYYGREGDGPRGRDRFDAPHPPREHGGRGRMGFSSVNTTQERPYREPPRGIRDVDTGRGANVRYFMIKSWNAENVAAAMRDSLWSTQVKNEQLLADAYNASRAVVLCFSVNNSKAFQGYALMASPPTPSLPKPAFCAKLNWPTSPAFRLEWLATQPVHFRNVGHIKNPLNVDDEDRPSAVLVGKDGQEIESEAGRRLCEVLDEEGMGGGARW